MMLALVFIIFYNHLAHGNICGLAPVGNCLQQCYAACRGQIADAVTQGVNNTQLEEMIATENFVCYGKCRGEVTTPKNAPGDDAELKQCVAMPCGDPLNENCMKGYLPKFFYCDCYKCCAEKTKKDDSACAAGCFDWFGKPDGPDGVTEVPKIGSKLTLCMSRCTIFMKNGEYWDFETKLSNEYCITDPERCSSSVKVTKLEITKGITDAEVTAATKEVVRDSSGYALRSTFGPLEIPNKVEEKNLEGNFTVFRSLIVSWPAAFPDMLNDNFIITCEPSVGTEIKFPTPAQTIDWTEVSNMLVSAFNADKSNAYASRRISNKQQIVLSQKLKLHSCETYDHYGLMTMAKGLTMAFEIFAEVSALKNLTLLQPFSAAELKDKVQKQWSSLTYVSDVNANTIQVKGTVTAEFSFGISGKIQGKCKRNSNTISGQLVCQDPAHDYSAGCVCSANC